MDRIQQTNPSKSRRQGTVNQRYKGSWELKWYGPADQNGNQKRISETVRGAKKEAEKILRERLLSVDNGSFVDKSKETVSEFMNRWLETYAATNVTLRTAHGYEGYSRRYINPTIGKVALQSLTPSQVQKVYADMLERGLSNTTVLHLHRLLKEALGHAVKWGIIARNVAEAASPPRPEQKQMPMWDVPTIIDFLELSHGTRFGHIHEFAVLTGLRRSEICGLKWESVDLEAGSLSVVATLQRIKGHGLVTSTPKTKRSRRTVDLAPETIDLLRTIRGGQMAQQLEYGSVWLNTGYVFTDFDGSPLAPDWLSKDFCGLVRAHGLPQLTFHGLRHAFATLGLKAGISPKVVSEALGHSSVGITLDIYSHVLPNMQNELSQAVANLLKRKPQTT